jgi:hypothetical protein
VNHHVSGALAREQIAEAIRVGNRSRLGSRRPIPPFTLPVVRELVRDRGRRPLDSELW